ncbi:putative B3 domain-containing protein [Raphanus sativus]|uniref:B3 domain-containing protein At1g78640 n=1 Tax=Raphanus sativus TaxID=3726 RepID=A0A6J0LHV3_RAPSA|nr:putative B3 domain-containing protein At1g78640 [Raphanus sativus]KAJ4909096.1 putative B3 domain-containing protein [Raphanus sativus]
MDFDLNMPPYTFKKTLSASDVGSQSRLMLQRSDAENHIVSHLSKDNKQAIEAGHGVTIKVYDLSTDTEHDFVLKRMVYTTRSYVLNGGWGKKFVESKGLKEGQTIGFFWDSKDSKLNMYLLPTPPAAQNNPN